MTAIFREVSIPSSPIQTLKRASTTVENISAGGAVIVSIDGNIIVSEVVPNNKKWDVTVNISITEQSP